MQNCRDDWSVDCIMERVGETQMLKCAKRREAEALTAGDRGDEAAEQRGWLAKRPCDSPPRSVGHCGGVDNDSAVRAIRGYCRDRGLSADAYTPVAGLCGGGGKFRLADLVDELHRVFAEDRVNVEYVRYLMDSYRSDPAEWLKYAKFSKFRYTRNLVDKGNGKFNLMVLCWGEGHGSSIHDHPQSDCVMKILAGQLNEVRFAWPEADQRQQPGDGEQPQLRPMTELSRTVLETDGVCHINGNFFQ